MKSISLANELAGNSYPGRGIVIGKSADGKYAVTAYFIMGRSENSRNRVFVEDGEGIRTQAFDPSKLSDPSLIIYAPVRVLGNKTIVTNGDQTDTIYELMDKQQTFEQALRTREFEPDAPNYTPRISGIMHIDNGTYNYAMSILKSNNGNPDSCNRYTFALLRCNYFCFLIEYAIACSGIFGNMPVKKTEQCILKQQVFIRISQSVVLAFR